MNINKISFSNIITFKGKIIDAHAHVGHHEGQNLTKQNLDIFVKNELSNKDTVEKMLVSDIDVLHGVKDEFIGNKETLVLFENDSHYAVFASCNPAKGKVENIKKLYTDNKGKFIGLKFHPQIQDIELSDERFIPYFKFANKHKIPCLFHSEVNLTESGHLSNNINKFSDPQIIYDIAKNYKKTPFVLAHMGAGWNEAHDKAINIIIESIKNGDANLYADISWVDIGLEGQESINKNHIIKAIKELKGIGNKDWKYGDQSFRLMFGTDSPLARFNSSQNPNALKCYSDFVESIKNAIKKDEDLAGDAEKIIDDLFYNNAKKLYLDSSSANLVSVNNKSGKILLSVGIIGAIIAGLYFIIKKYKNPSIKNIKIE